MTAGIRKNGQPNMTRLLLLSAIKKSKEKKSKNIFRKTFGTLCFCGNG